MSTRRRRQSIQVQALQASVIGEKVSLAILVRGAWLERCQDLLGGFTVLDADKIAEALKGRKRIEKQGYLAWEPKA